MKTKKLIVGNWKMNPRTMAEALKIFTEIKKDTVKMKNTDVVMCPPAIFLPELSKKLSKNSALGAQTVSQGKEGAFTGEISTGMLDSLNVKYIIVGHSERREMGETDFMISKKVESALNAKLYVVLCVGEKERDEECTYLEALKSQIENSLQTVPKNLLSKLVIAYEPVWAIGEKATGKIDPAGLLEIVIFIRKILSGIYDQETAHSMKILYGGSVDETNAEDFMKEGGIGGLLVGRASLNPKKFIQIVKIAENL